MAATKRKSVSNFGCRYGKKRVNDLSEKKGGSKSLSLEPGFMRILFGWLLGRALLQMSKPEQRVARKTYHAFRALTARRRSSKIYHFSRLFD
jgi:hypothetical protein